MHFMAVAGRIRSTLEGGSVPLQVTIAGPDDSFTLTANARLDVAEGVTPYGAEGKIGLLFALSTQVPLLKAGVYTVVITLEDGSSSRTLKFEAQPTPQ
jgi:hypothetical protein